MTQMNEYDSGLELRFHLILGHPAAQDGAFHQPELRRVSTAQGKGPIVSLGLLR